MHYLKYSGIYTSERSRVMSYQEGGFKHYILSKSIARTRVHKRKYTDVQVDQVENLCQVGKLAFLHLVRRK